MNRGLDNTGMNKINIVIPDNLTPNQEVMEIAKLLGKKLLPSNQKYLGDGYEIKHLETQITIKRIATEKAIITHDCPVCKTTVEQSAAKVLWTNYGGKRKKHHYCSDNCRDYVSETLGLGRSSTSKNSLGRFNSR